MKTKILYYISALIAIVFIVVIIALNIADVINLGMMLGLIFGVIFITIFALVARWYWASRQGIVTTQNKRITIEKAREMALTELMNTQYSEYESQLHYEDTWDMGDSHDPIYVRLSSGIFDKNYISILINLTDPEKKSIKMYEATENRDKIDADVLKRANLLSKTPRPETKYKVIESLDPSSGRMVSETTPLNIEKEEGGELK